MNEFVHYRTDFYPGVPSGTLVLAAPQNGQLTTVAIKTSWEEGHLPTLRKVLKKWRQTGQTTVDLTAYGGGQAAMMPAMQYSAPPMMYYQPPMMRFSGGGGGNC
jgi:hypothetical protein